MADVVWVFHKPPQSAVNTFGVYSGKCHSFHVDWGGSSESSNEMNACDRGSRYAEVLLVKSVQPATVRLAFIVPERKQALEHKIL
jgi:hypothetical protein